MQWTVGALFDMIQELIGEDGGAFYNQSTRLRLLNQAQDVMLAESKYYKRTITLPVTAGKQELEGLPLDFLTFSGFKLEFKEAGASAGARNRVDLVAIRVIEERFPAWRETKVSFRGTPQFAFVSDDSLTLVPTPNKSGTLTMIYVANLPNLTELDEVVFNGVNQIQRFAPGLAFYVANQIMLARDPQTALLYKGVLDTYLRDMRYNVRTSDTSATYLPSVPIVSFA